MEDIEYPPRSVYQTLKHHQWQMENLPTDIQNWFEQSLSGGTKMLLEIKEIAEQHPLFFAYESIKVYTDHILEGFEAMNCNMAYERAVFKCIEDCRLPAEGKYAYTGPVPETIDSLITWYKQTHNTMQIENWHDVQKAKQEDMANKKRKSRRRRRRKAKTQESSS